MPPVGKPLKNDGPACRVCGCTENNACLVPIGLVHDGGCSWVPVEGGTEPLCSACSGTEADMAEAIERGCRHLKQHTTAGIDFAIVIGRSALLRRKRRQKTGSW